MKDSEDNTKDDTEEPPCPLCGNRGPYTADTFSDLCDECVSYKNAIADAYREQGRQKRIKP